MTVNTVNNKIYVGIHITETPYKFDGYYGNGITGTSCSHFKHPKTHFQKACKKYGLDAFRRYTLYVCNTYEEAQEIERQIVTDEFVNRPDTYNIALGGGAGLVPSVEIPVYKYDLEGNFMEEYRSQSDAGRKHQCSSCSIAYAIEHKKEFKEAYWSETKLSKFNIHEVKKKQSLKVYMYNSNRKYLQEFPSIASCARHLDVNDTVLRRAIKNNNKCAGVYVSFEKYEILPKVDKKRIRHTFYYQYDHNGNFVGKKAINEIKSMNPEAYKTFRSAIREKYAWEGFFWRDYQTDRIEIKEKKKKIYQFDLEGNLIKIWDSYRECAKEFRSLRLVLNGSRSQTKGYNFKYTLD